jgi:dihydroxyacetone kinase
LVTGRIKKLINEPSSVVDEMLEAFVAAHGDRVALRSPRVVARAEAGAAKVGFVIGGGSGHEPAMLGYVGYGLADAAAIGNIFAAPSPEIICDSIVGADRGQGVVLVYGNYTGDVMNCSLALRRANSRGIDVRCVFVTDDVASAARDELGRRRGIAGDIFVFKTTGAAAERGYTLDEVERVARAANVRTRSMAVALTGGELPGAKEPIFESAPGEMELGMGVHGEPGMGRGPLLSAEEVGRLLATRILEDLDCAPGSSFAVLVNGMGATPLVEQYLVYRGARHLVEESGHGVARSYVGEYITSMQMAGLSVSLFLLDDEMLSLLDAPARAVSLVQTEREG